MEKKYFSRALEAQTIGEINHPELILTDGSAPAGGGVMEFNNTLEDMEFNNTGEQMDFNP